jgi:hypothetical protein
MPSLHYLPRCEWIRSRGGWVEGSTVTPTTRTHPTFRACLPCDTYITALSVSNQHRLKLWTAEDHGGAPRFNPKK